MNSTPTPTPMSPMTPLPPPSTLVKRYVNNNDSVEPMAKRQRHRYGPKNLSKQVMKDKLIYAAEDLQCDVESMLNKLRCSTSVECGEDWSIVGGAYLDFLDSLKVFEEAFDEAEKSDQWSDEE